jgi:serine/threonine-protein kinase
LERLDRPDPIDEQAPAIPGYAIGEVIGRGSTGVVYRAKQLAVERDVALKILHADLVGTRAVKRLQREARTTARLAHPGIITAIDMGQVQGRWWYAMELVEGRSLAEILAERGRVGERESLRLFIPLCEALVHLHESGVVHRDIKPGNILVDRRGGARLVDLGLAFLEEDPQLTGSGGTLGTPNYISPEQARNPRAADVRSDIYSFGATMYHALCSRPPFAGESIAEILSGVLYAPLPDPRRLAPELSKGMVLLLRKCLARSPARRYPTPKDLLADLERLRERRSVSVRASGLEPLARSGTGARRALLAALGAALLAFAALYWSGWADGQSQGPSAPVPAPYPPLEQQALLLEQDLSSVGSVLAELERLRAEVPPKQRERYEDVLASAHRRYNGQVAEVRRRVRAELDELLLDRRDYAAAASVLRGVGPILQASLGLSREQLDAELQGEWMRVEQRRVREHIDAAVTLLRGQLERYYLDVVLPRVNKHETNHRWASARSELAPSQGDWLKAAGLGGEGLPSNERETLLAEFGSALSLRVRELEGSWSALDGELLAFVEERCAALLNELERRDSEDAAARLQKAFNLRLRELGLHETEALFDVSRRAWDRLESCAGELADREQEYLESDAAFWFERTQEELAPLYAGRDYKRIESAWRLGLEHGWPAPLQARIELLSEEARLLGELLDSAVAGVRSLQGRTASMFVGNIVVTGTLIAPADPLKQGLRLRAISSAGGGQPLVEHQLALSLAPPGTQLVTTIDIERLAGLPEDPALTVEPRQRLARALFRFHEGDSQGAADALLSGPLPEGELRPLVDDFSIRVRARQQDFQSQVAERLELAQQLYRQIKRARTHLPDAAEVVSLIDELLREYGDVDWVRERDAELRALRRELTAPPEGSVRAELERTLDPDGLALLPNQRVRLEYSFTSPVCGKWDRGAWLSDGLGWIAPRTNGKSELMVEGIWPRLQLRDPLDERGQIDAQVVFEQPSESGPPRLLLLTVAGVHFAFGGSDEGPCWLVASERDGLHGIVEDALLGKGESFAGLRRGARHELKVSLTRGRQHVRVFLDGVELGSKSIASPASWGTGGSSIVVRSLEPVRVLAATIEAGLR